MNQEQEQWTCTPIQAALRDIAVEERLAYNWRCVVERRYGRRAVRRHPSVGRIAAAAGAVAAAAVLFALFGVSPEGRAPAAPLTLVSRDLVPILAVPAAADQSEIVRLSDGSRLSISPGAALEVVRNSAERFETSLKSGWVRFDVTPGQGRTWVIDAGLAEIEVVGTQFTVRRTDTEVTVAVHRGAVRVLPRRSGSPPLLLAAGAVEVVTAQEPRATPPPVHADAPLETSLSRAPGRTPPGPAASAPRLRSAPEADASRALSRDRRPVAELLQAADEARARREPARAARILERVVRDCSSDPAWGLAALTLGKVRMAALHHPGAAAEAFALAAGAGALPSALREQALARQAAALHAAGRHEAARAAARKYDRDYPSGRWRGWIAEALERE